MKKQLLSTLLTLCMVLALLSGTALAADTDFIIVDGVLTEYKGPGGDVLIPDSVTVIGNWAFADCVSLNGVTIPGSVSDVSSYAFVNCANLTSVTISDGVASLWESVFLNCTSLTSVAIPNSMTEIGSSAFANCMRLTDIYYGGSEGEWESIAFGGLSESLASVTIHYNSTDPGIPDISAKRDAVVMLSQRMLLVDGETIACETYNIDGSDYFKLRDLACALTGTGFQFDVSYYEESKTVSITTGEAYEPAGTELKAGVDNSSTAQPSSQTILIDGVEYSELTAYNIGGSNFFQPRELGDILGFEVDFDDAANTAFVSSK